MNRRVWTVVDVLMCEEGVMDARHKWGVVSEGNGGRGLATWMTGGGRQVKAYDS